MTIPNYHNYFRPQST